MVDYKNFKDHQQLFKPVLDQITGSRIDKSLDFPRCIKECLENKELSVTRVDEIRNVITDLSTDSSEVVTKSITMIEGVCRKLDIHKIVDSQGIPIDAKIALIKDINLVNQCVDRGKELSLSVNHFENSIEYAQLIDAFSSIITSKTYGALIQLNEMSQLSETLVFLTMEHRIVIIIGVKVGIITMYSFIKEKNFSAFLKRICQGGYYSFTSPINKVLDFTYNHKFKFIGGASSILGLSVWSACYNKTGEMISSYEFDGKLGDTFRTIGSLTKKASYNIFRVLGGLKDGAIFGLWGEQWDYAKNLVKDVFNAILKKK